MSDREKMPSPPPTRVLRHYHVAVDGVACQKGAPLPTFVLPEKVFIYSGAIGERNIFIATVLREFPTFSVREKFNVFSDANTYTFLSACGVVCRCSAA